MEQDVAMTPIEIACEEVWGQISNYLDDEVEAAVRATMASHFKDCARCSAVLDGVRNVIQLIGDSRAFEIPVKTSPSFYRKLNDYLAARQPD